MILVDTSVWIDHLRVGDAGLAALLDDSSVLAHPWVTGELALGEMSRRHEVLGLLQHLPKATVATEGEVLSLIETQQLFGRGIGWGDAHLVAAAMLTPGTRLRTRDKQLDATVAALGLRHDHGEAPAEGHSTGATSRG